MSQNLSSAAVVIGALRAKLLLEDSSTKHSFQRHKNMTSMVNPTKKGGGGGGGGRKIQKMRNCRILVPISVFCQEIL